MTSPQQITVVEPDRFIRVIYDTGVTDAVYLDLADWPDLTALAGTPVHAIQWRRGDATSHIEPVEGQPIALSDDAVNSPILVAVMAALNGRSAT